MHVGCCWPPDLHAHFVSTWSVTSKRYIKRFKWAENGTCEHSAYHTVHTFEIILSIFYFGSSGAFVLKLVWWNICFIFSMAKRAAAVKQSVNVHRPLNCWFNSWMPNVLCRIQCCCVIPKSHQSASPYEGNIWTCSLLSTDFFCSRPDFFSDSLSQFCRWPGESIMLFSAYGTHFWNDTANI